MGHLRPRDAPTYSEEEVQALSRRSMCDSPLKSFEAKLRQYLRCLTHAKTFPRRLVTGASSLPESGDKLQAGSLLQRPTRNSPTKSSTALPIASMQRQLSLNRKLHMFTRFRCLPNTAVNRNKQLGMRICPLSTMEHRVLEHVFPILVESWTG